MKNFRKVLALILVVATLFSFVAMASAKTTADYADASDVKYVEAVDVLSSIGILKGYDGKYHPNDTIDRDEMAKMIAVLRNGGEDNSALFTGANTFADVKGSWAEGYIAYAAQVGVVNGRNATTFDPDGKVTGVEVMKMLLCVLGYNAKEQGYVGANWQTNVLRDATKMGLMAGMADFDAYAAATRDEAAQLMLNALRADMVVGYVSKNIVNITNSLYIAWNERANKFDWTTVSLNDAEKGGWEFAYCNAVISNVPLYTIFDGLYRYGDVDCYGRPGHTWLLEDNHEKVLFKKFYVNTPDYVQTSGDSRAISAAAKDLHDTKDDYWTVRVDGAYEHATKLILDKDGKVIGDTGIPVDVEGYVDLHKDVRTANKGEIGNGVLVEMYDMGDHGIVVIVNTYIAEVANVSKYYNHFDLVAKDKAGNTVTKETYKLNDYNVKNGDMVLYWTCNGYSEGDDANWKNGQKNTVALHDLTVVEPVVADITAGTDFGNINNSTVSTAEKTYNYANNFGKTYVGGYTLEEMKWEEVKNGASYKLYLDQYGYVMFYADNNPSGVFYAYAVENTYKEHIHGNKIDENGKTGVWKEYFVDLVKFNADGELVAETVTVDEAVTLHELQADGTLKDLGFNGFQVALTLSGNEGKKNGALLKVKQQTNGKYIVITDAENNRGSDEETNDMLVNGEFAPFGTKLNKNSYKLGNGVYCTSKTVFMIRTTALDGTKTYKQVTGYANLDQNYAAVKNADGTTNMQYFVDPDHKEFASYVFIDAKLTTADCDHFLLLGQSNYDGFQTDLRNLYGKDYVAFDALVDGAKAVMLFDKALEADLERNAGTMWHKALVYLGVAVTTGDTSLPVYYCAEMNLDNQIDTINYKYEVVDGEIYISVTDKNAKGEDVTTVYKAAADCKFFTITANWTMVNPVTEEMGWALDVVEDIIPKLEGTQDGNVNNLMPGYLFTNNDGEVTELYKMGDDFTFDFWG